MDPSRRAVVYLLGTFRMDITERLLRPERVYLLSILSMRYFCKNVLLFLAPFLLIFAPAAYLLWQAGEFYPLKHISTALHTGRVTLYGPAYSNTRQELQKEIVA